jgi:O-antigen/teichoic acid export membrane protein
MTRQPFSLWMRSQSLPTGLLPARDQLRGVILLVGGNVLKLGLGFGTSVLIFRTLGPGDAGRLALTLSVLGLFSIIGEFGLRDAAVNYIARWLPVAPDRAAAVARTFLVSKTFLTALASSVAIFVAGWLAATFYSKVDVAGLIRLGAFSLFMDGLLAFATVVLEARRRFAMLSALGVIQAALRAGLVGLFFVLGQVNLYTLLALESIVPLAVFVYALRVIPRSFYAVRSAWLEHLGLLWHFAKWVAVAALASTIFLRLDVLMLSYFRTPVEVGFYAAAFALVSKLDVVKSAVLTTAFPEACRRSGGAELRQYIVQSLRMTVLASLGLLSLFVFGGALIELLYGVEYRAAVPAFYPLLAGFIIGLNAEPVAYVLYPLDRPRWIAASDLTQLVFCVLINLVLIPAYGMVGAAWGVLLTRLTAAVITLVLVRRFLWQETSLSPEPMT